MPADPQNSQLGRPSGGHVSEPLVTSHHQSPYLNHWLLILFVCVCLFVLVNFVCLPCLGFYGCAKLCLCQEEIGIQGCHVMSWKSRLVTEAPDKSELFLAS